jgi:hypothetical protein
MEGARENAWLQWIRTFPEPIYSSIKSRAYLKDSGWNNGVGGSIRFR